MEFRGSSLGYFRAGTRRSDARFDSTLPHALFARGADNASAPTQALFLLALGFPRQSSRLLRLLRCARRLRIPAPEATALDFERRRERASARRGPCLYPWPHSPVG